MHEFEIVALLMRIGRVVSGREGKEARERERAKKPFKFRMKSEFHSFQHFHRAYSVHTMDLDIYLSRLRTKIFVQRAASRVHNSFASSASVACAVNANAYRCTLYDVREFARETSEDSRTQ